MNELKLNHRRLRTLLGWDHGEVTFEVKSLSGGLVAETIACVLARRRMDDGRRHMRAFVVKHLSGAARREAPVHQHLGRSKAGHLAPLVLDVEPLPGGGARLYMEAIRPINRWPWREIARTEDVMRNLAHLHRCDHPEALRRSVADWDYERELQASARQTLEFLETSRPVASLRPFVPALRRVVHSLAEMRQSLLGFDPLPPTLLHGDVHPGNVMVRVRASRPAPVLLDWARARIGSPLEDVSSWLQSLGYYEPRARSAHDRLLGEYLDARGLPRCPDRAMRRAYWLAGASNVLSGALRYHLTILHAPQSTPARRAQAHRAARDALRILRRADQYWRLCPAQNCRSSAPRPAQGGPDQPRIGRVGR